MLCRTLAEGNTGQVWLIQGILVRIGVVEGGRSVPESRRRIGALVWMVGKGSSTAAAASSMEGTSGLSVVCIIALCIASACIGPIG